MEDKSKPSVVNGLRPNFYVVDELDFLKYLAEEEIKSLWDLRFRGDSIFMLPLITGTKGEKNER